MIHSWRHNTLKVYKSFIIRYINYCELNNIDIFKPKICEVLDWLAKLYQEGLSYSSINCARSALSSFCFKLSGSSLGSQPDIVRFMKGVYELRTPVPKLSITWDVNILFEHFRKQDTLDLKSLSHKLCSLLMLATFQRVQTIASFKLSGIIWTPSGCTIFPLDKLKHTRRGYHQEPFKLMNFSESKICPVLCLKEYIERTKEMRDNQDELFISFQNPFKAVSKDTISRWLTDSLRNAGVQNFSAHSYRSASASHSLKNGHDVKTILKNAGWTREDTFRKFYLKPIQ